MSDEELKAMFASVVAELSDLFESRLVATTAQFDAKIDSAVADMRLHFDTRINSTNDTMHSLAEDMRLHFDIATEGTRVRFDQLAEAIATVDEKADRNVNRLDEKIERGFADTNALIKYSYDTLDHRVAALEKK
jgi:hypothetical protein